ncbi:DUF3311 domain-containing protein [Streptomyces sp. HNM0575]|uniref:DUF3311 domain-containing protein n=1 Tax=Streptomyces sp. HNM0575 TaxID=2716338 RepID=UPI00145F0F1A|nr:DUF3311 domain-containing protein [Streptomyces sp. HNM0575]NLU72020.1 DUF3311 domain-containing protein [Streptomyces sp. HNM0575]
MPAPPETSETASQSPSHSPVVTPVRVVVGLCLFIPFVALMWVSSYSRTEPTLAGLPFFYWYQMLWVLISAVMTMVAYKLVKRDEAARRRPGGDRDTGGDRDASGDRDAAGEDGAR